MNLKNEIIETISSVKVGKNKFDGFWAIFITIAAVAISLAMLWFNSYGKIMGMHLRGYHLATILPMVFLVMPWRKSKPKCKPNIIDIVFAIASFYCMYHMVKQYDVFSTTGTRMGTYDFYVAAIGILLIIEATRRTAGWSLVILSVFFLFYARYGNHFPGGFKIVPFSVNRIVYTMFYTDGAIFGTVCGVSATYIFLFILFGSFLGENKSSEFFTDLALAISGDKPGGPGKVAVLSSALMGSISGSAVANVATTGVITIPLMKRVGYKPHFAGAVEAVASSGGQILPPVMASAAFIMAEMVGVPYLTVISAALIPAILYYVACWIMLDLEARKNHLEGIPKEELPVLSYIMKTRGHLALPLIILIIMLVMGRTALFAGFWGIIATIVISAIRKDTRLSIPNYIAALRDGTLQMLSVAMPCAIVGIIVGVCSMTGVGVMMAGNIIKMAGGNLLLGAILAMLVCLILGMGLPTAACYITAGVVVAPALTGMGMPSIAAHMFVLYYSVLSNLTPPVALASYTAAGIAECSVNKTAFTGFKLGLTGFIVPFMFVFTDVLLLQGTHSFVEIFVAIVTAFIGVLLLSFGLQKRAYIVGNISIAESIGYLFAAVLLMNPGVTTDAVGVIIAILLISFRYFVLKGRPDKAEKSPAT